MAKSFVNNFRPTTTSPRNPLILGIAVGILLGLFLSLTDDNGFDDYFGVFHGRVPGENCKNKIVIFF